MGEDLAPAALELLGQIYYRLERFDEAVASLRIACPILQTAGAGEDFESARKLLQDLERSRLTAGESA